jgi:hypothetical protein
MNFKTRTVKTGEKYYIINIIYIYIYITTTCELQLYVALHPNPREEIISSYLSVTCYSKYSYTPIYSYVQIWRAFPPFKILVGLNLDKYNLIYTITCHSHLPFLVTNTM